MYMSDTKGMPASSGQRLYVFLCLMALMGVLFGTLIYCYLSGRQLEALSLSRDSFISSKENDLGRQLMGVFFTNALFMLVQYLLGLCAAGAPFAVCVLIYRAIGFGTALACIVPDGGALKLTMLILPDAFISLLVLIIASKEAIAMSGTVLKTLLSQTADRGLIEVTKLYSVKFMVLLAAAGIGSLISSVSAYIYTNHLNV